MSFRIDQIHPLIADLISLMNQPQRDDAFLAAAGVSIDRALFTLLVGIHLYGPLRVGELADRAGRDYTTVSRQLAKLTNLGFIRRARSAGDSRAHEAALTDRGEAAVEALKRVRERIIEPVLVQWSDTDWNTFIALMRRFVDDLGTAKPERETE